LNILEEALAILEGDREQTYGNPAFNLETIAEFWMKYLERKHGVLVALLPDDVATMMILLKVARLMKSPDHRDSLVDIAGYAGLIDKCNTMAEGPLFPTEVTKLVPDEPKPPALATVGRDSVSGDVVLGRGR
jgi:uncharacterized protein DUF6378